MPPDDRLWIYDQISRRDAEIAARCAIDMTVAEIADELRIHESTVYDHIRNVAALMDSTEKRDVARWWRTDDGAYMARLRERFLLDNEE